MEYKNDRKLLSAQEVCAERGICRKTLSRWVKAGKFPEPVLNDDGRLYWDAEALPPAVATDQVSTAEPKPVVGQELHSARIYPVRDQVDSIGGGN